MVKKLVLYSRTAEKKSMGKTLSDHQDSNHFTYNRSWEEIETMLDKAERKMNYHRLNFYKYQDRKDSKGRKQAMYHARNYKALEGVCKTLRWTLGDIDVSHPLE
jgi:hypothetical protein